MTRQPQIPLFQALESMLARAEHAPECELQRLGLAGNKDWVCVCNKQSPAPSAHTVTAVTAVTAVTDAH